MNVSLFLVLLTSAAQSLPQTEAESMTLVDPGCDDSDPTTRCCPLYDFDYLMNLADWYSCLDSPPLIPLTRVLP
jgi:hypothetical protein